VNRIERTNRRYDAAASMLRRGIELFAVGDPAGARLNNAVGELLLAVRSDGPELWGDLLGAAKALRWRLITQPQPLAANSPVIDGAANLRREVGRLRDSVGDEATRLLDALAHSADELAGADPPAGVVLMRCIDEVDGDCVVLGENQRAVTGLLLWLADTGVSVLTPGGLRQAEDIEVSQAYAVGPPRIFGPALITAPPIGELSFVVPAWFGDRSVPHTLFAPLASGPTRIRVKVREEGDLTAPAPIAGVDDEIRPQPVWSKSESVTRAPGHDEVVAHKVLLGGGRAIFLDEAGDRIRALDPAQPPGERVLQIEVANVRPGAYLVLSEGQTEPRVLYERAMVMLGDRAAATEMSQQRWKSALQQRLDTLGSARTEHALAAAGVLRASRATEWVEPTLARPRRNEDFEELLRWLDLPVQPAFTLATHLWRLRMQASADIREQLERAVSEADLSVLERDGFIRLDLDQPGFRGMIAARVLAISPDATVIARHEARLPFLDRSAQWLE
jgi:hypothetical protein